MMHVVKANIAAEPLQDLGKLEKRGTAQSRLCIYPFFVPAPVGILELVLHIEKENSDGGRKNHDGQPHHDQLLESEPGTQPEECNAQDQVSPCDAVALAFLAFLQADGETVENDKQQRGADDEHH